MPEIRQKIPRVVFEIAGPVDHDELNELYRSAWPLARRQDFKSSLECALVYVCAYEGEHLVGFAKVISDGGAHGFLLDPIVAPDAQRKGIGRRLVDACATEAQKSGIEWLHVDFEPHLTNFYKA